jgi:phospholipid/cholesterol/gamma-HCH transport system substrate-binding protein
MAQHKQLTWNELRVGVFVLAGLFLVVLAIFYVTGATSLGAKYRLHTFLPEVDGLAVGAPVRLDGVEIGNVETITIAPALPGKPMDPNRSIEVVMRLTRRYQSDIRTDSSAGLVTEGLLGDRYVDIGRGFKGSVLQDGEEVPGHEEEAMKQVVERSADVLANLSALTSQIGTMVDDVKRGRGSLGKLLEDQTAYNHLNSLLTRADDMIAGVQAGQGTLGQLVSNDRLYTRVDSVAGRLDNVLEAVQQQRGSLGRFVYDPTVHDEARQFLANGNGMLEDVRNGKGTIGKLATDDSLFEKYREIGENLASATAKLNSNEGTTGKLFNDPQFYDNMTGLAGDMRLLVGDFRKNPKKFLRVKFSLF